MESYNRKSIFSELSSYDIFAKEGSFIEVTEWKNGEGFDVEVNSNERILFSLTWGQYKALKKVIKQLNK